MNKVFLLVPCLLLTACDIPTKTPEWAKYSCQLVANQSVRKEMFLSCLNATAEARKGVNYTTNDDEDYHLVVEECDTAAYYQSKVMVCGNAKERWDKAQKPHSQKAMNDE